MRDTEFYMLVYMADTLITDKYGLVFSNPGTWYFLSQGVMEEYTVNAFKNCQVYDYSMITYMLAAIACERNYTDYSPTYPLNSYYRWMNKLLPIGKQVLWESFLTI